MLDEKQLESLEKRLTEPLTERVQERFVRRYGVWFSVFAVVAGYFGYDTYLDIRSYKTQVEALQGQLTTLNERLDKMIADLDVAQERLEAASSVGAAVSDAQVAIHDIKREISDLTNRQFSFVVESAADIYLVAEKPANVVDFYKQAQGYAKEIDDRELLGFATLRLARAYSRLGARDAARKAFRAAEKLAREQFESHAQRTRRPRSKNF